MKLTSLCLVFFVPFVSCIMGGADSNDGSYKFVVSIRDKQNYHICAGALIETNFVLTAVTCVSGLQPQELIVMGGIKKLDDSNGIDLKIDKIFSKNATGENKVRNNIALLLLKKVTSPSAQLDPIRLVRDDYVAPKVGERCKFFGWGYKNFEQSEPTNHLQVANTKISYLSECKEFSSDIDESNLCTNDNRAALCSYDSGDPLVSGQYLWGIATQAHSCGGTKFDVFTRVDSHKDWIREIVKEENASTDHKPQKIVTSIIVLLMLLINL